MTAELMIPSREVFALHLAWSVLVGIGMWDEAFMLRVVERVRSGEVLHRDVFFGALRLGVHLGRVATLAFGVEIGAIEVACAACATASALLASRLARQVTGTRAAAIRLSGGSNRSPDVHRCTG
jgi:hypothetical protein